ncbi:bifunctional 4-hydroxy-2-oxoglutarate aldolase/2-dehydro-3-deoxy-phosphogluconate aldolase [Siccirubricoccus sp. KC 17139]|uniref:Bifunctional 4-hydroxy-2-oxoglutarate aldolase/2-dehydro-3-deoxy-phosphogluconate aldolase n=1 Tax=Siccirubricoccus soli TaxID=2899147 RepID=A0ABT1DBN8_9PROT|nr:bifunctional 4-hydroxy-2-oxoglutarate aldolase/2-dehydro-3-deoxy-phosphogluconate aldolase [Siccirubricoccus soli]MCO6418997.1 bifunctional 4-hydroxy-2-oxoglutarate aldolase/2-dehydro-3-deoxy-phosphogluconate aldolase [Siccirubricoccus soli]MCP2685132.1 bifunctional 4-hydroxy-2-oxoglutarate aldolase/2-dehydro-3-deoxy-phosphogluconate aldolase [Siccirubricoccus soli]
MPHELIAEFRRARVVPVIRTHSAEHAATACDWLRAAGLRILEITLTTPDAVGLIRGLAAEPDLIIGAGTVPDVAAAEACLAAGARFLVTPWVAPEIVAAAHAARACAMLGAATPTEIRAALAAGADVVKIFPASSFGGPAHVKAVRAVFPEAVFCPTGGVDAANAPDYLAAGAAFVGIGGKLVDEAAIAAGKREVIARAARDALGLMQA